MSCVGPFAVLRLPDRGVCRGWLWPSEEGGEGSRPVGKSTGHGSPCWGGTLLHAHFHTHTHTFAHFPTPPQVLL